MSAAKRKRKNRARAKKLKAVIERIARCTPIGTIETHEIEGELIVIVGKKEKSRIDILKESYKRRKESSSPLLFTGPQLRE